MGAREKERVELSVVALGSVPASELTDWSADSEKERVVSSVTELDLVTASELADLSADSEKERVVSLVTELVSVPVLELAALLVDSERVKEKEFMEMDLDLVTASELADLSADSEKERVVS